MAKSAEYKQQFKEEKKKRKIAYKNKKNAKIARFRFGKNLFIWFIGLITSWVLVAAMVLISLSIPLKTIAPVQTEQNPDGAISEQLGEKTILELFSSLSKGGLSELSMKDFPVLVNAVDGLIQDSGISNYVKIDKEKLSNLKFSYSETEVDANGNQKTFATELVGCIEVTATIDSVAGEGLGDLEKLSVFSQTTQLSDDETNEIKSYATQIANGEKTLEQINSESENKVFNPVMYCVEQTEPQNSPMSIKVKNSNSAYADVIENKVFVRAFDDNGNFINGANENSTLYYRALKNVPILELTQIISDSFERVETNDIFKLANIDLEAEENKDGILNNLLGGKKLSEIGSITTADIKIADFFGEIEDDSLIKTLLVDLVNAEKGEGEKVAFEDISIDNLTAIGEDAVSSIKISTFLTPPDPEAEEGTEESEQNKLLYDILKAATRPADHVGEWKAEDITIGSFSNMTIENIQLSVLLTPPDPNAEEGTEEREQNKLIYEILKAATRPTGHVGEWKAEDITIGSFSNMTIENIQLSVLLTPPDPEAEEGTEEREQNKLLYDILIPATRPEGVEEEDWTAEDITISHLSDIDVEKVKLVDVATLDADLINILKEITRPDGVDSKNWSENNITIGTLADANINKLSLHVVLDDLDSNVKKILTEACEANDFNSLTLNSLTTNFKIDKVSLTTVIEPNATNGKMFDILKELSGVTTEGYDDIKIRHLADIDIDNLSLTTVIEPNTTNGKMFDILKELSGVTTEDYSGIKISHLGKIDISKLKLSTIVPEKGNETLYEILESVVTGLDTDGEIRIENIEGIKNFGGIKLSTVLDVATNGNIYNILVEATKPTLKAGETDYTAYGNGDKDWTADDITVADLSNFNMENISLEKVIPYNADNLLCKILCEAYNKTSQTYGTITVANLKAMDISNVSLATVLGGKHGDNNILKVLLQDNTVTVGNLGEKINGLSIYDLYGENCWTDVKPSNSAVKYFKSIENGKVVYRKCDNPTCDKTHYYVKENAGIWLLVCFNGTDTDSIKDGRSDVYTQSELTFDSLKTGTTLSDRFTNATLRQLKDAGIIEEDSIDARFDTYSFLDILEHIKRG